jgi:hypothetical protein
MLFLVCFIFLCLYALMCGYLYSQIELTFPSHSLISSIARNVSGLSSCQEIIHRPSAEINIQMPCVTLTWICTRPDQCLNLRNKSYCRQFSEDCVMQYDMIWYDMIWCNVMWYMIWYDMMWCNVMWYDVMWYMIWYDMIWCDILYDMMWYDVM